MRARSLLAALLLSASAIVPAAAMPPWMRSAPASNVGLRQFVGGSSQNGNSSISFAKPTVASSKVYAIWFGTSYQGSNNAVTAAGCTLLFYGAGSGTGSAVGTTPQGQVNVYQAGYVFQCPGGISAVSFSSSNNYANSCNVAFAVETQRSVGVKISAQVGSTPGAKVSASTFLSTGHPGGLRIGMVDWDQPGATITVSSPAAATALYQANVSGGNRSASAYQMPSGYQGNTTVSYSASVLDPTAIFLDIY